MSNFCRSIPFALVMALVLAVHVSAQTQGLANTSWRLAAIHNRDGTTVQPDDPAKYTLEFKGDGTLVAQLNCNRGSGTWKSPSPGQLQLGPMAVTTAACLPPSLDTRMAMDLAAVHSYVIEGGHLHLILSNGGYEDFAPQAPAGLPNTSWQLVQIHNADGTSVRADDPAKITVAFDADGSVIAQLDCNRGHGTWKSPSPGKIELSPMAVTRMMCLNASLADRMAKDWNAFQSYAIEGGHLRLMLSSGAYYEFEPLVGPSAAP